MSSVKAPWVLGTILLSIVVAAPAIAGETRKKNREWAVAAQPLKIQYEHVCECRWAGWCDDERTWFKTVRYEKVPDRNLGCFATQSDLRSLEYGGKRTCQKAGFRGLGEIETSSCKWSVRRRLVPVEPAPKKKKKRVTRRARRGARR